jgi:hypothetical protein
MSLNVTAFASKQGAVTGQINKSGVKKVSVATSKPLVI